MNDFRYYLQPMRVHDPWPLLVLLGLIGEISGALLLAVEAIGPARVRHWASLPLRAQFRPPAKGPWWSALAYGIIGVPLAMGAVVFDNWLAQGWPSWIAFPLAVLALYSFTFYAWKFFLAMLRRVSAALLLSAKSTEKRTAAAYGALFLLCGFILQFIGVVGTFVISNLHWVTTADR
jgi:hypothetical protein